MDATELNHLVVVHANMLYFDYDRDRNIAKSIRDRALATLKQNKRVFLLPIVRSPSFEECEFFSELLPQSVIIPWVESSELGTLGLYPQFISLKEALIKEGIRSVDLAGVARSICVKITDHFLKGEPLISNLPELAESLGTERRLLENLIKVMIRSRVMEELCMD